MPILPDNSLPQTLVKTISREIVQNANVNMGAINAQLRQILTQSVGSGGEQKLSRVNITSQQQGREDKDNPGIRISVDISGVAKKTYQDSLEKIFRARGNKSHAATEVNGLPFILFT